MPIITISRGSEAIGREVAEKVAHRLGYGCISREILLDASEIFNVPELKLERAIHDAPSLLDRFSCSKERYIAYIQAALLRLLREDNIVYHGLAGHFFVRRVPHALKVRVTADMGDRVRREVARKQISSKEAERMLRHDDEQRQRWSLWLYGIDTSDPMLYDMVLHLKNFRTEDAAEVICCAARLDRFQATADSRRLIADLSLAAEVRAELLEMLASLDVSSDGGRVHIHGKANTFDLERLAEEIRQRVAVVRGVRQVEVALEPMTIFNG